MTNVGEYSRAQLFKNNILRDVKLIDEVSKIYLYTTTKPTISKNRKRKVQPWNRPRERFCRKA